MVKRKEKGSAKASPSSALDEAEAELKSLLLLYHKIDTSVDTTVDDSVNLRKLQKDSQTIVDGLVKLESLSKGVQETFVPIELIDAVEQQGANPDLVMKDWLKATIDSNQKAKGRAHVFQVFEAELCRELSESYPAEYADYLSQTGQAAGSH